MRLTFRCLAMARTELPMARRPLLRNAAIKVPGCGGLGVIGLGFLGVIVVPLLGGGKWIVDTIPLKRVRWFKSELLRFRLRRNDDGGGWRSGGMLICLSRNRDRIESRLQRSEFEAPRT